jgi:hypothetical protein
MYIFFMSSMHYAHYTVHCSLAVAPVQVLYIQYMTGARELRELLTRHERGLHGTP